MTFNIVMSTKPLGKYQMEQQIYVLLVNTYFIDIVLCELF